MIHPRSGLTLQVIGDKILDEEIHFPVGIHFTF